MSIWKAAASLQQHGQCHHVIIIVQVIIADCIKRKELEKPSVGFLKNGFEPQL